MMNTTTTTSSISTCSDDDDSNNTMSRNGRKETKKRGDKKQQKKKKRSQKKAALHRHSNGTKSQPQQQQHQQRMVINPFYIEEEEEGLVGMEQQHEQQQQFVGLLAHNQEEEEDYYNDNEYDEYNVHSSSSSNNHKKKKKQQQQQQFYHYKDNKNKSFGAVQAGVCFGVVFTIVWILLILSANSNGATYDNSNTVRSESSGNSIEFDDRLSAVVSSSSSSSGSQDFNDESATSTSIDFDDERDEAEDTYDGAASATNSVGTAEEEEATQEIEEAATTEEIEEAATTEENENDADSAIEEEEEIEEATTEKNENDADSGEESKVNGDVDDDWDDDDNETEENLTSNNDDDDSMIDLVTDDVSSSSDWTTDSADNESPNADMLWVVLGERHTGVEWLEQTLRTCYTTDNTTITSSIVIQSGIDRPAYWFQNDYYTNDYDDSTTIDHSGDDNNDRYLQRQQKTKQQPRNMVVFATIRDPYTWITEMRYRPIYSPNHRSSDARVPLDLKTFLQRPWNNDGGNDVSAMNTNNATCQFDFSNTMVTPCLQQSRYDVADTLRTPVYELKKQSGTDVYFHNIVELRTAKHESLLYYKEQAAAADDDSSILHFILVPFEDDGLSATTIAEIFTKTGLSPTNAACLDDNSSAARIRRHHDVSTEISKSQKFLRYMEQTVDWDVEREISNDQYHPIE